MPVDKWTRQGWQLVDPPAPQPITRKRKEALVEKRRTRSRGPLGALLFCFALIILGGVFANDWYATHFPRVAIAKVEPPSAPPVDPAPVVAAPPKEEVKPPLEPAPVVEEEPPAVAEDDAPKEDVWAEERERLQHKRGRGAIIVNPRVIINGNAFAFNGANVFRPQIVVPQFRELEAPDLRAFAMPGMIDPEKFAEDFFADVTARRIGGAVQATILAAIPEARHFVARFEVAPKDGHLVVTVRDAFLSFNDAQRRTIIEGLAEVWRDSRFTKQGCSRKVDFLSPRGWHETTE